MTLFNLVKCELRSIFTNPIILLTMFGGVVFYSFLYPLPYSHQTPTEQTITVVNLDNSLTSFQLERMVDATSQIKIAARAHSIEEAKQQFIEGKVTGILVIPEHFYKELLLGKSPTLSFAGDASYFLVYGAIVEGITGASGTLAAKARVNRMVMEGQPLEAASGQYASSIVNMKPTFNPEMGYVNYVVPAVFVLILQQTLIMSIGVVGGTQKFGKGYWTKQSSLRLILTRSSIFIATYYFLSMYYFGFSFDFYDIHRLAEPLTLLALLAPFLLSSCFIGSFLGAILPRRELVAVVVLISSMPLIFSAGFIWPLESVPQPMIWLSNLIPCTPAIQAFLKINQLGADFTQIMPQWSLLWGQCVAWGLLAWVVDKKYRLQLS
ncbi:ABC transporter permease [Vibrio algarum]|uniref:ABC transporter permease n=1 Tax=Vibrio algarum TaxID=3020714 RepID=A0ABT4YQI4_9VIBR|nr:ABC transporter permease [Vibrio sp. KJ40-1]MDB1123814.1 ABC transporter permease [Vibrio sp. KJ40-1]